MYVELCLSLYRSLIVQVSIGRSAFHYSILSSNPYAFRRSYGLLHQCTRIARKIFACSRMLVLGRSCVPHFSQTYLCVSLPHQATLINKTATSDELNEAKNNFVRTYGRNVMRALLHDFARVAPRSATPNLVELMSTLVTRFPLESKQWMLEVLNAVSLIMFQLMEIIELLPSPTSCHQKRQPRRRTNL